MAQAEAIAPNPKCAPFSYVSKRFLKEVHLHKKTILLNPLTLCVSFGILKRDRQKKENPMNHLEIAAKLNLEDITKNNKLLLIRLLADALYEMEICPALDDSYFINYFREQVTTDKRLQGVVPLLKQFQPYNIKTIEKILKVLTASM